MRSGVRAIRYFPWPCSRPQERVNADSRLRLSMIAGINTFPALHVDENMSQDNSDHDRVTVRLASVGDSESITVLCHQLGYPTSREEMQQRLEQVLQDERHAVFVAELSDGRVAGWVHVHLRWLVIADLGAEIEGLVVDQSCRRRGIGRLLMQRAEEWARRRGCRAVQLRSNVIRKGAHVFYENIGYSIVKTQLTFRKVL
ncbi:MAG: N-acetyltransferase [Chloroflexi bacterium]|nr:MAG: N-acetyltransferase [Chloroflexota bacterium]